MVTKIELFFIELITELLLSAAILSESGFEFCLFIVVAAYAIYANYVSVSLQANKYWVYALDGNV